MDRSYRIITEFISQAIEDLNPALVSSPASSANTEPGPRVPDINHTISTEYLGSILLF